MNEREIIEKIRRLERREKQLYRNNRIFRYNTGEKVHLKQLEFHKCQKRNRWVFGGNRSGKTECGAVEVEAPSGIIKLKILEVHRRENNN